MKAVEAAAFFSLCVCYWILPLEGDKVGHFQFVHIVALMPVCVQMGNQSAKMTTVTTSYIEFKVRLEFICDGFISSSPGSWTWRGRSTSRQPLTATSADQSLLGRFPKSLSSKYSTCSSWSTHPEAERDRSSWATSTNRIFLIWRTKAKVRDKSALKMR